MALIAKYNVIKYKTENAKVTRSELQAPVVPRGVDPYGTGGTRPPNIWTGGT